MPEIPDLEVIAEFLTTALSNRPIAGLETSKAPWLIRSPHEELETLPGKRIERVDRYGKFLLFRLDDGRVLLVNPMLTGRFRWSEPAAPRRPSPVVTLRFEDGWELRYADERRMGRWYLVAEHGLGDVPQFGELGPDALALDEAAFVERLKRHRGQIKNVITNQRCLAGIGNAYSDEILWEAGLHPHRVRSSMDDADLQGLYHAMHAVFGRALPIIGTFVADGLKQNKTEWRAHLQVHRRGGLPCPRCGEEIRSQVLSGRETNYCLHCQPLYAAAGN